MRFSKTHEPELDFSSSVFVSALYIDAKVEILTYPIITIHA